MQRRRQGAILAGGLLAHFPERLHCVKRIQWLIVLLALAPVFLFVYSGQFARLIADDDCHVVEVRKQGTWGAALHLISEEGRYSSSLLTVLAAPLDTLLPKIAPAVLIACWLVGWYWLVLQGLAFLKIAHSRQALSMVIAALTVTAIMHVFIHYTYESLYRYTTIIVYIAPLVLLTFYMALAVWMARRLRKNILSLLGVAVSGAICFLIAGFSETHLIAQLLFLAFCLLMSFAFLGNSVRAPYILLFGVGWLASLLSLILQLTSPGIAARTALTLAKYGPPDLSVSVVTPKIFAHSSEYIIHPAVFTGFIMLMGVGLLVTLVKYKPRTLSKASKSLELTSPVLRAGLIFHLLVLPWHGFQQSMLDTSAADDQQMITYNILFILSFLVMLWQRKRINVQLQKHSPGLLFLGWFAAAALIFLLLAALPQTRVMYFYSSSYLFISALALLAVLTSLHTNLTERKLGLLAFSSYVLGCVSIIAVVVTVSLSAQGSVVMETRTLLAGVCLLTLSGLVWGIYIGFLAKHHLASLQTGQAWIRFLKAGSLAIIIIVAVNLTANQAAVIPDYQRYASVWDANHQKIIAAVREGKDLVEIPPLPLHTRWYHRGCWGRYYYSGSTKVVITDD